MDLYNYFRKNSLGFIKKQYSSKPKLYNYYLGLYYCKRKDYNKALMYFFIALNLGLTNYLLYYNIGVIYLEIGDNASSKYFLEKSIKLNNHNCRSYLNLAYAYISSMDIKSAYRTIKMGTSLCENDELISIEKKLLMKIRGIH